MPACSGSGFRTAYLVAQSVPEAARVPCVDVMPVGWFITARQIRSGGARFVFDSDRAGAGALELTFGEECETSGAVRQPADEEGVRLYADIDQRSVTGRFKGSWFYLFDGGCVTYLFDFKQKVPVSSVLEIQEAFRFVERAELERRYEQGMGGETGP